MNRVVHTSPTYFFPDTRPSYRKLNAFFLRIRGGATFQFTWRRPVIRCERQDAIFVFLVTCAALSVHNYRWVVFIAQRRRISSSWLAAFYVYYLSWRVMTRCITFCISYTFIFRELVSPSSYTNPINGKSMCVLGHKYSNYIPFNPILHNNIQ